MTNKIDYSEFTINISWHVEDVKNMDDTLTLEQCAQVLESVKNNHDAEFGVTWDTISHAILSLGFGSDI